MPFAPQPRPHGATLPVHITATRDRRYCDRMGFPSGNSDPATGRGPSTRGLVRLRRLTKLAATAADASRPLVAAGSSRIRRGLRVNGLSNACSNAWRNRVSRSEGVYLGPSGPMYVDQTGRPLPSFPKDSRRFRAFAFASDGDSAAVDFSSVIGGKLPGIFAFLSLIARSRARIIPKLMVRSQHQPQKVLGHPRVFRCPARPSPR